MRRLIALFPWSSKVVQVTWLVLCYGRLAAGNIFSSSLTPSHLLSRAYLAWGLRIRMRPCNIILYLALVVAYDFSSYRATLHCAFLRGLLKLLLGSWLLMNVWVGALSCKSRTGAIIWSCNLLLHRSPLYMVETVRSLGGLISTNVIYSLLSCSNLRRESCSDWESVLILLNTCWSIISNSGWRERPIRRLRGLKLC